MKKFLAQTFFKLMGWKLKANITPEVEHSVMVAAPHTSNWDFPYALAGFWLMNLDLKYFIKDMYTKGLHGYFFRWTGAIGVNRKKTKNNLTDYAIELLKANRMEILVPALFPYLWRPTTRPMPLPKRSDQKTDAWFG